MAQVSELDTMKEIGKALSKIQDPAARNRVLEWAWDKYSSKGAPPPVRAQRKNHPSSPAKKPKGTSTMKVSIVKDLNLKPSGKKAFKAFIDEKRPKGHPQQCTIAIYYLQHELEMNGITPSHIYTCYREANWRLPSNLPSILTVIASRNGWIDTSDMANLKVSAHGLNLVEQDLPKKQKK